MRARWIFAVVALSWACGGSEKPRPVAHEGAFDHLRRIGHVWSSDNEDDGLLTNDPNGVSTFHVHTKMILTLEPDGVNAKETIDREESFQLVTGERFACRVKGDVRARAEYAWSDGGDVSVTIDSGTAELPRACDRPGFPVPTKSLARKTTRYLLRSDQLVSTEGVRTRETLLPIQ